MFTISIILFWIVAISILYFLSSKSSGRSYKIWWNISGDFGSGGGKTKVNTVSDTYGGLREPYLQNLTSRVGQDGPVYQGQRTAPMSEQERQSLERVSQYGNTGYGTTFAAGKKQIEDTLGGNYDPATSPYYQAVKAQSAQNLADTQKNIASNAAGGGRFWTGAKVKQQGRAATDNALNLNTIMGQQAENERQRQVSLVPQAMAYGDAERNVPLQQSQALQTLGALPRNLQQNDINSMIENFYRSQYDYPLNWAQIIAGVQAPPVQTATPQNSGLQNATQGVSQAAMLAAMMAGM